MILMKMAVSCMSRDRLQFEDYSINISNFISNFPIFTMCNRLRFYNLTEYIFQDRACIRFTGDEQDESDYGGAKGLRRFWHHMGNRQEPFRVLFPSCAFPTHVN